MQFELTKLFLKKFSLAIDEKRTKTAIALLKDLHFADIAEIINSISIENASYLFPLLNAQTAADVLVELEENIQKELCKRISAKQLAKIFVKKIDSDDAADILGILEDEKKNEIIKFIDDIKQAGDIVDLLNYDEDTAGGLMAKEFICVKMNLSITACLRELRKQVRNIDEIYYIYVIDNNNILKGTLSLKRLLLSSDTDKKISSIYNANIITVQHHTSSADVAQIMQKYDLVALPVTDNLGRLLGKITIDDVIDVIQEEAEKDYQMISGITGDIEASDKIIHSTKVRLPWLLIGLVGGIIGAHIIGHYESNIIKYTGIALFLPLIAAMAGNVGVQSSSIIVQGLANNSIIASRITKTLFRELIVGVINAVLLSSLIFMYNYFFSDNFLLAITVSISLFVVVIFASLFGTFVPLILNRFKIDPALATGPFITTTNDIFGLLIYLMIAGKVFVLG